MGSRLPTSRNLRVRQVSKGTRKVVSANPARRLYPVVRAGIGASLGPAARSAERVALGVSGIADRQSASYSCCTASKRQTVKQEPQRMHSSWLMT